MSGSAGVGVLCQTLDGALISDLTVVSDAEDPAEVGVILDDWGDCKVVGVSCVGFRSHGIWLHGNSFPCEIRGCSLAGNGQTGIYLDHLWRGRGGDWVPNLWPTALCMAVAEALCVNGRL